MFAIISGKTKMKKMQTKLFNITNFICSNLFLTVIIYIILTILFITCKKNEDLLEENLSNLLVSPEISTIDISDITQVGATSSAIINNDGDSFIYAIGVIWSEFENPLFPLSSNNDEGHYRISYKNGIQESGTYIFDFGGLSPNKTYYLKAYVSFNIDNLCNIVYGNEVSFTTEALIHGSVTDIEGNNYNTVQIGNQVWMAENLKTTKYNDGTDIIYLPDENEWSQTEQGAYVWHGNNIENKEIYGALYNWYAVETEKLCPEGWHVPSDDDWKILEAIVDQSFGGDTIWDKTGFRGHNAGCRLKTTEGWSSGGNGSDVFSFSAKPTGYRYPSGGYAMQSSEAGWWTSSENSNQDSWYRRIVYIYSSIERYAYTKTSGFSVRCVKNSE